MSNSELTPIQYFISQQMKKITHIRSALEMCNCYDFRDEFSALDKMWDDLFLFAQSDLTKEDKHKYEAHKTCEDIKNHDLKAVKADLDKGKFPENVKLQLYGLYGSELANKLMEGHVYDPEKCVFNEKHTYDTDKGIENDSK